MKTKPILIYNPAAAMGKAATILPQAEMLFADKQFEYDLVLTTGAGSAQQIAYQAALGGCRYIIAAGGDGTINETINGIMQAQLGEENRPALGVLPVGRGNDFAYGMGIPLEIEAAVAVICDDQQRKIDLGYLEGGNFPAGRYFGNGVGLGFDAVVGFEAAKLKWLHGAASYLVAVTRTIFLYANAPVYEAMIDGKVIQQPFLMVSIMNGSRMGGMFHMTPGSDPSDGCLDFCLVGKVPQWKILPLAMKFINATHTAHPAVQLIRAQQVMIRAVSGSIPAHADGETICEAGQQLTVKIIPHAIFVRTGKVERTL